MELGIRRNHLYKRAEQLEKKNMEAFRGSGRPRVKTEYVWFCPVAPPKWILQLILDLAISSDCEPPQTDSGSCYVSANTFQSILLSPT
jgi:hypothetical protein